MAAPLSLRQTAAAVGLTYDRFRKVWTTWVRERGFPAPFSAPGDAYAWNADSVEAWKHRQELARAEAFAPPPAAANDGGARFGGAPAAGVSAARLARERQAMAARMKGLRP